MSRTKYLKFITSALLMLFTVSATPVTKELCHGFLPPNDMKIPVGDHSHKGMLGNGGITEEQYNMIMDRIQKMYGDYVTSKGATLVINRLWTDDTVNSSAQQQGSQWIINMYGGIARHPDVTFEGEALIACHEMGHHIGGAPKIQSIFGGAWATNEGGADYFATLKCLRILFADDDNASIIAAATIDPLAKSQCEAQYTVKAEQELCMRISMAGESVSYLFQDLSQEKTRPQFSTPDMSQVGETNDDHPATQCRMDTYFSGSICPVAVSVPNSDNDFKAGSCVQGTDAMGFRPRCWFNPDSGGGGGGGGGGEGCPFGDDSLCQKICDIDPSQPFCKK
jgi:hypothetical protein